MLEEYIETLKPYVVELFKGDSSGHDISHLVRTMKLALYIQEREGGDRLVIGIASFLHDVHRIMQNETGVYVSPKDSIVRVKELLSHVSLTEEQVEKICYAIEYHEKYNWNGDNVEDINTLVLQDADNLDSVGAIGIGRAFSYSGAHNSPMYRDDLPLEDADNYNEHSGDDPSSIHHFYHKLFKLGDNMNTKTAKELADKRVDFMKDFVNEFLMEWNVDL